MNEIHVLSDVLFRLCDKLREVYRSMALQDGRHRRDSAASDCVRLGKIVKAYLVSMRTCRYCLLVLRVGVVDMLMNVFV